MLYCFSDSLTAVPREPSNSRPTGCSNAKGDRGLGPRAIYAPPSWVSAISLFRQEEFCWGVSVHQETSVAATSTFHTTRPTLNASVPALKGQRSSVQVEIHMRPGPYKGVTQRPTRIAHLTSSTITSCIAPRARLPPLSHSKRDFYFPYVPVCRTLFWG